MSQQSPKDIVIALSVLLAIIVFLAVMLIKAMTADAADGNVTVNWDAPSRAVSPLGMDESGYGQGNVLTNDALQRQRLDVLGITQVRMDLKYADPNNPNSQIRCGGSGCAAGETGDQWISAIKGLGAEPLVIVQREYPQAAANMVRHFNVDSPALRVPRWIIGNEPDGAGVSAASYSAQFNAAYDAMKAVDPSITICGPATAWFNINYIKDWANRIGGRLECIDYHAYGQGGNVTKSDAQLMADAGNYSRDIGTLRGLYGNAVQIEIGEWNLDWNGDARAYTNFNTVWGASAIGHMLSQGAQSLQYADKNGSIGALYEVDDAVHGAKRDDPMPIYWAHWLYTGGDQFRPFAGNLVAATSNVAGVEVYAATSGNVVLINKNATAKAVDLNLGAGSYTAYRKDGAPLLAPVNLGSATVSGTFSAALPAYSVTVYVVDRGAPTPGPTPTPTPSPTPAPTPSPTPTATPGPLTVDVTLRCILQQDGVTKSCIVVEVR